MISETTLIHKILNFLKSLFPVSNTENSYPTIDLADCLALNDSQLIYFRCIRPGYKSLIQNDVMNSFHAVIFTVCFTYCMEKPHVPFGEISQ